MEKCSVWRCKFKVNTKKKSVLAHFFCRAVNKFLLFNVCCTSHMKQTTLALTACYCLQYIITQPAGNKSYLAVIYIQWHLESCTNDDEIKTPAFKLHIGQCAIKM